MKRKAFFTIGLLFTLSTLFGMTPNTEGNFSSATKKSHGTEMGSSKRSHADAIDPRSEHNFAADFGNLPVKRWERSTFFDEAVFTKEGKDYRAFYDLDGNLVGTTSVVKFSDLPAYAQKKIQTKYKDYQVGKVIYYDDDQTNSTDMYLYGRPFESADNYFVELTKGTKRIVLQSTPEGEVFFFTEF